MIPLFKIAAVFTIAKIWKQPRCSSIDEQIKIWNAYTHDEMLLSIEKE